MEDASILKYRDLVYKVYNKYYGRHFSYLEDDLIQCGYWGLWLAMQKYDKSRCESFTKYAWCLIHSKMWQYIDHEKHHITKETHTDEIIPATTIDDVTTKIDIDNALKTLNDDEYEMIVKWANYSHFKELGQYSRQNSHHHFKKILKKLKEKLK